MYKRSRSLHPHSRMPVFWCWALSGMTAAMLILHPELMLVAGAAQLATNSTDFAAGDGVTASTTFGGEALGNATRGFYNLLNNIVSPLAAVIAGAFGLFALIRGFNLAVIGGAFGVAIIAGLLPTIILGILGVTPAIF